jgi:hypothetical protein
MHWPNYKQRSTTDKGDRSSGEKEETPVLLEPVDQTVLDLPKDKQLVLKVLRFFKTFKKHQRHSEMNFLVFIFVFNNTS